MGRLSAVLCGLWGVAGCVRRARALSFCQRSLVSFSHILPKSSYVRTMPQPQTLCRVVPASPDTPDNVTAACPVHLECLSHYPHAPQTHADNSHSTQGAPADNCAGSSGEACRRRVARASDVGRSNASGGGHGHAVRKVVPIGLPQPLYDVVEQEALACRSSAPSAHAVGAGTARARAAAWRASGPLAVQPGHNSAEHRGQLVLQASGSAQGPATTARRARLCRRCR